MKRKPSEVLRKMTKTIKKIFLPFERFITVELLWMTFKYLIARQSNHSLKPFSWLVRKNTETLINRTKIVRKDNSFANESETLEAIFTNINVQERFLVDIGASDGIRQSSTSLFLVKYGWKGALFESQADSFSKLAFLYNDRNDLQLYKGKVTPANISGLLEHMSISKNFGFLNIDIDSYDLAVLREMLEYGFNPSVISMEINEIFPPEIYFEVLFEPEHSWNGDHFFGCSLAAANVTMLALGYSLVRVEYNNAFFVRKNETSAIVNSLNINDAYSDGYRSRKDRHQLFPWNLDVEYLHSNLSTVEKIDRIQNMFSGYKGKYILHEIHSEQK